MSAQGPLHEMGVAQLGAGLKARAFSALELARHCLARAEHDATASFLALNPEVTLAQARASDARRAAGNAAPLEGVPVAHKDIFVTRDFPTTAGSKMLAGYRSPFDATVVARLAQAGMVTVGKLSCDEFAMGSGNENCAYGPVRNPWDAARVPGGSSGAAPRRWPRVWCQRPPVPTPAAPFASPPAFAVSPASSPPMAAPAGTA